MSAGDHKGPLSGPSFCPSWVNRAGTVLCIGGLAVLPAISPAIIQAIPDGKVRYDNSRPISAPKHFHETGELPAVPVS
jgi:hypothetical protein